MNVFDYFFENTFASDKLFLEGKESASFRDLYNSSRNLAANLEREFGHKKNILLISSNDLYFLKSYLGIIKSGNICIPLDPNIESENYNFIFNLTNPAAIFTTGQIKEKLGIKDVKCIQPEDLTGYTSISTDSREPEMTDENDCAEIIFTSGSTGKPKGVMISHRNLIANTESIIAYLKLSQSDRMLVVLPFYYCYGLSLLHTHLRVGGSIVFNNGFIFLGGVIRNLLDYKCTGFAGVPSHFQILLRKSELFKKTHFPDLKYVTQAGGKLATIFIDEFRESQPDVRFIIMYGQTEATARLSWLPPELYEKKRGSMGKGIPGVELKVINENGEKIRPGEIGEVIARGDNIMLGYFQDEEGTRNSIRNGWLYTGDLGTVDEEDYIYLTARKKEIIKVGGKRISPKEIEAVILQIPEVVDCSVEGVTDELQGEALKATIVVNRTGKNLIDEQVIKQYCSKHLALYKIPKYLEIKSEITISATGKRIKK